MKYKLVIFDMDGTLADTSQGILNSHRYAHKMMGRAEPTDAELDGIIGGPLLDNYKNRFFFSDADARKAIEFYRHYYAEQGIHEAKLYPDMGIILKMIKQKGISIGIATLKAERFAKTMLKNMNVYHNFDIICGMDEYDSRTKAQLIQMCIDKVGVSLSETILIGDSTHDLNGARQVGIDFIGVSYGFGFSNGQVYEDFLCCKSPMEVLMAIMSDDLS